MKSILQHHKAFFRHVAVCISLLLLLLVSQTGCYHPVLLSDMAVSDKQKQAPAVLDSPEPMKAPKPSNGGYDEDEAVRLVLAHDGAAKLMSEKAAGDQDRAITAGRIDNPELRVGQLSTKDLDGRFRTLELGLRWNNPKIGEPAAKRDIANVRAQITTSEKQRYLIDLAYRTRALFIEIAALAQSTELLAKQVELHQHLVDVIAQKVSLNEESNIVLIDKRMALLSLKQKYREKQSDRKILLARLQALTGVVSAAQFDFGMQSDEKTDLAVWQDQASLFRPELEQARLNHLRSQAEYHIEKSKQYPWFSFVEPSLLTDQGDPGDETEYWGELRLGIELPIFNWNTGNVSAAKTDIRFYRNEYERQRVEIHLQVTQAFEKYIILNQDYGEFNAEAATLIADAKSITTQAQQLLAVAVEKIIGMQLTALSLDQTRIEKKRDAQLARAALIYSTGRDLQLCSKN